MRDGTDDDFALRGKRGLEYGFGDGSADDIGGVLLGVREHGRGAEKRCNQKGRIIKWAFVW